MPVAAKTGLGRSSPHLSDGTRPRRESPGPSPGMTALWGATTPREGRALVRRWRDQGRARRRPSVVSGRGLGRPFKCHVRAGLGPALHAFPTARGQGVDPQAGSGNDGSLGGGVGAAKKGAACAAPFSLRLTRRGEWTSSEVHAATEVGCCRLRHQETAGANGLPQKSMPPPKSAVADFGIKKPQGRMDFLRSPCRPCRPCRRPAWRGPRRPSSECRRSSLRW